MRQQAAAQRYHATVKQIRALLALLRIEVKEAEKYRALEGIDLEDAANLDRVAAHLTRAYGILAADEDITTEGALRGIDDHRPEKETAPNVEMEVAE